MYRMTSRESPTSSRARKNAVWMRAGMIASLCTGLSELASVKTCCVKSNAAGFVCRLPQAVGVVLGSAANDAVRSATLAC